MDDSELVPPSRLSMTDAELEAAVERAKAGPDGLMSAIMLLEEQAQLRAQDDANLAAFEASQTKQAQSQEPVFEPTPSSQASEFDAILGAAIEGDRDDLFSDTDFSVTGTLAQIVEQVNEDFAKPQQELDPESDDQVTELSSSPDLSPIPAFAANSHVTRNASMDSAGGISNPAMQPDKKPFGIGAFFDGLLSSALATTAALVMTLRDRTEMPVTSSHLYGLLLGMLLATTFGVLFSKARRLAGEHFTLVSRPTFGVWGAAIPALGVLIFKLVVLAALVLALAGPLWRAFNFFESTQAGSIRPAFLPELAALVASTLLLLVFSRFKWMQRWFFAVVTFGLFVVAVTNFTPAAFTVPFAFFDFVNTAVQTALIYLLVQLGFGLVRPLKVRGSKLRAVEYLAANLLVPALLAGLVFLSISISPSWIVFAGVITLLGSIAAMAVLLGSVRNSFEVLWVKLPWLRLSLTLLLVGAATYFVGLYLVSIATLTAVLAVPAAAAIFATLADQIARRINVHEVSMVRGYGFYGRISTLNIIGFALSNLVGFALLPGFAWSAQTEPLAFFGAQTSAMASGLLAFLFTATISRVRVERQETEVSKVERRKNELAGIDEIVGLP